jgi:hypothetical protein
LQSGELYLSGFQNTVKVQLTTISEMIADHLAGKGENGKNREQ